MTKPCNKCKPPVYTCDRCYKAKDMTVKFMAIKELSNLQIKWFCDGKPNTERLGTIRAEQIINAGYRKI
jgi:hypothetical protein